jgi:putative spermidine/putrescine transport system permease protein
MKTFRAIFAIVIVLGLACPAFLILPLSVSSSRFLGSSIGSLSSRWFVEAASGYWLQAMALSIGLGALSATLATLAAIPAAYFRMHETNRKSLAALLDAGALATLLVPSISLAVGYFRVFGEGGLAPLVLGHITLGFAFPYLSLRLGARNIDPAILDAAKLLGASTAVAMVRVWLPAVSRHLFLGFLLAFLTSWDETVMSIFLTDPQTITLPKAVWETMQRERDMTAAAINVVTAPLLSLLILWFFTADSREAPKLQPS